MATTFRRQQQQHFSVRCGLALLGCALLAFAAHAHAAESVSHPFEGVTLYQIVRHVPQQQVITLADIAPDTPGVRFLVTPAGLDPAQPEPVGVHVETTRETVVQAITSLHAQLGINGAFFTFVKGTLDTDDRGLVVSNGRVVSPPSAGRSWVLNVTAKGKPEIVPVTRDAASQVSGLYNAIAGRGLLVRDGRNVAPTGSPFDDTDPPRTAVGVTAAGHLLMMAVDGRQPGFSRGMRLRQLAAFMLAHGAVMALNFDGGGSTTMAIADPVPRVLNFPSDHKPDGKPGELRAVGVSLVVFARANPRYVRVPPLVSPGADPARRAMPAVD